MTPYDSFYFWTHGPHSSSLSSTWVFFSLLFHFYPKIFSFISSSFFFQLQLRCFVRIVRRYEFDICTKLLLIFFCSCDVCTYYKEVRIDIRTKLLLYGGTDSIISLILTLYIYENYNFGKIVRLIINRTSYLENL